MSPLMVHRVRNSRSSGKRSRQRGFSILNLVIVVSVVGVLSAIALPSVSSTLQLHRLDTSASIMASKLSEARMQAIKRNRQVWLLVDPANQTMRLQTTDNSGSTINLGAAETLSQGVSFVSPSAQTQLRFDSLGRLPAGTAAWTITLQGAQNTKRKNVTISITGTINLGNMTSYSS